MAPPEEPAPDRDERPEVGVSDRRTTGLTGGTNAIGSSMTAAVAVALFAWGGMKLDQRWDTQPWMLLLGASLGGLGGFLYMLKELSPDLLPWSAEPSEPTGTNEPAAEERSDGDDA